MKNKVLALLLGGVVAMTTVSGCSQKNQETELQVLEISSVEVMTEAVTETESETESETETETETASETEMTSEDIETEFMELDLTEETELQESDSERNTEASAVVDDETEALTSKSDAEETPSTRKPGADQETSITEKETEEVKKTPSKGDGKQTENSQAAVRPKETESRPKETENLPKETEKLPMETETRPVETESPATETELQTQETESETDAVVSFSGIMTVNDRVNVRKEPSTDAERAALFTPGMKLLVIGVEGDWAQVRFESEQGLTNGYVKSEFLFEAEKIYAAKEKVNVRKEASTDSEKLGELLEGDKVILVDDASGEWFKVRYSVTGGIVEAYVKGEFLEVVELNSGLSALLQDTAEETAVETEEMTEEAVTEEMTEAVTEPVTEAMTEAVTEEVTEAETEEMTENITEEEEEKELYTVNDRVNVRASADTISAALDLLIPGNLFELVSEEEEWSKIHYIAKGKVIEGYIKNEFVEMGETVYEALEKVNVRKEASTDSDKLTELLEGDLVVVLKEEDADETSSAEAEEDQWHHVCFSKGGKLVDAYVKAEFLQKADLKELLAEAEEVTATTTETETEAANNKTSDSPKKENAKKETSEKPETAVLSSGILGQFELAKLLVPELSSVGMIYSEDDAKVAELAASYEEMAASLGITFKTVEIVDSLDIDLAASSLVGTVSCVFCMDDPVVNELVQTICAYADEVEIPVIGISEEQVSMGCLASYVGADTILNKTKADAFDVNADDLNLKNLIMY